MLKPFTSPANLHAKLLASNCVMRSMPGLPASRLDQDSATVLPTGLTHPRPVTTTRRLVMGPNLSNCRGPSGLLVGVGVVDSVLHRRDLFGVLVRNLDPELVLERHHQLHRVERIGTEV